jgi:hypothetical protein
MNPSWRNKYLRYKLFFLNVMLKYKDKPQVKAYLEIILSLATISIFGVFAIKPTAVTIAQLLKEIEAKKTTIATMEEKIGNLEKAQTVFNDNSGKIALLEIAIPKRPTPEGLTRQIEGLSGRNNVEILKVSTSGGPIQGKPQIEPAVVVENPEGVPVEPELFQKLGFTINMKVPSNQYVSLANFSSDLLYKIRYPISLDVIRMDIQSEKSGKNITLTVNGKVPYDSQGE